jgi:beta-lactamase regulating signal transducer with metallopeptidase domain
LDLLHATARLTVDWMVYCLMEGAILSLFVWLLLRLLPRQNAGTRFVLWFSALLAMMVLPFLRGLWSTPVAVNHPILNSRSFITLPESWAFYIFVAWAIVVLFSLTRVVLGLWQVRRLRKNSQEVDASALHREVRQAMQEFSPALTLRVSDGVRVPAAIGFFAPAIIVPNWFLEEMSGEELKQVLRHEIAHLRRRDGWTNLAQKIIKAVLFFHPSAWWIEQQLSLEREIACDDAVLAQATSPLEYAQCLKHVAEKSFMRRKLALAQAVVSAVRQLSLRMARILDADRPGSTRLWKPAVPIVVTIACVCGLTARTAPELVSFTTDRPVANAAAQTSNPLPVAAVKAELRSSVPQPKMILASAQMESKPAVKRMALKPAMRNKAPQPVQAKAAIPGDYVVQSEQVIVSMTSDRVNASGQPVWQVRMWQVRVLVPANNPKTISRKNI